jgi:hypothetical protein
MYRVGEAIAQYIQSSAEVMPFSHHQTDQMASCPISTLASPCLQVKNG